MHFLITGLSSTLLAFIFLLPVHAYASGEAPRVLNLAVSKVATDRAVLVVKTGVASEVTVHYRVEPGGYAGSVSSAEAADRHELTLENLSPDSEVFYQVTITDSNDRSRSLTLEEKRFATTKTRGQPFSYGIIGDYQNDSFKPAPPPLVLNTIIDAMIGEGLDMAFQAGDQTVITKGRQWTMGLADSPEKVEQKYNEIFAVTQRLTAFMPFYIATGNHEEMGYPPGREVYQREFALPEHGIPEAVGENELYYSFDHGDTHFIVLSTEVPGTGGEITGHQREWLEKDLMEANVRDMQWKVVVMHRYVFPELGIGESGFSDDTRQYLHGLFRDNGVDIVFQGHEHNYRRHIEDGLIYVTTVGGASSLYPSNRPCPSDIEDGDAWACTSEYVKVDETETSMAVAARQCEGDMLWTVQGRCNGETLDAVTLAKPANREQSAAYTVIDGDGGDCGQIGKWDSVSRTCSLNRDLWIGSAVDDSGATQEFHGIVVDGDGITLDGDNHRLIGDYAEESGSAGVLVDGGSAVNVMNLTVEGFHTGIFVKGDSDSGNTVSGNIVRENAYGIILGNADENQIEGNKITVNRIGGIGVLGAEKNTITGNDLSANTVGLHMSDTGAKKSASNQVYGNNFIDNSLQVLIDSEAEGNVFSLPAAGGNHWSDWVIEAPFVISDGLYQASDDEPRMSTIDTSAPVVTSIKPEGTVVKTDIIYYITGELQEKLSPTELTIEYKDSAPSSGIDEVAASINTGNEILELDCYGISQSIASCNIDSLGLEEGSYIVEFVITDNAGNISEEAEYAFTIVPTQPTVTIEQDETGGGCVAVGQWDSAGKTCTLDRDLYVGSSGGIRILGDGITLDGGGHRLIGQGRWGTASSSGVVIEGDNNTVKNLSIENFGFVGFKGWMKTAFNGYWLVKEGVGVHVKGQSSNNRVYNNNFIGNVFQARVDEGATGNVFNESLPEGGNYWSNGSSSAADAKGILESPFLFMGGQDFLPWAKPNGWWAAGTR